MGPYHFLTLLLYISSQLKRFHVILECINGGFPICNKSEKFYECLKDAKNSYISEHSWYLMPVSVHKILFHSKDILDSCILPKSQLSEEPQEARNKHSRKFRELFTGKTSRTGTNTDLMKDY